MFPITKEEIGAVLKKLRLSSGKTQKEVAELLGRKQQVIGHWETGYAQPDANTLFEICALYGVSVDEAFGFSEKGNTTKKGLAEKDSSYSSLEQEIIKAYRAAPPVLQEAVLNVLHIPIPASNARQKKNA